MSKEQDYAPGLWHRLMAAGPGPGPGGGRGGAAERLTLAQLKASVARDLENLLNTRVALAPSLLEGLPLCSESIINYGMLDFAALSLASSDDRKRICTSLQHAIACFEPRLHNVEAQLLVDARATRQLDFVITGTLRVLATPERIRFKAMLQPSNLRYAVSQLSGAAREGA